MICCPSEDLMPFHSKHVSPFCRFKEADDQPESTTAFMIEFNLEEITPERITSPSESSSCAFRLSSAFLNASFMLETAPKPCSLLHSAADFPAA